MSQIKQELIDAYLRNELSGAELASFEQKMASDPTFKEEVMFEQYVKEGISQFRKAQLKARLNALEIAPGSVGTGLGASTLVKTVGGLVLAGILGTAAYYLMETKELSVPESSKTEFVAENNTPEPLTVPKITVPEYEEVDGSGSEEIITSPAKEPITPKVAEPVEETISDPRQFIPQVTVPAFDDIEAEEALKLAEVEIPEASKGDEVSGANTPVDVETIHKKSETITYKYFDGKLFLYGDFREQPYEILEINGTSGRKLYLYFDTKYYGVEVSDKVEELPRITDEKLIKELEILRNNKRSE